MSDVPTSASPAELTPETLRRLDATVGRLLDEADQVEDAAASTLTAQLRRLQAAVRDQLAEDATSFAVVSQRIQPALAGARAGMAEAFAAGVSESAAKAAALVDETLALMPSVSPLPPVTVVTVLDEAGVARSMVYVDDVLADLRRNIDLEVLRLVSGEADLAEILGRVGTDPAGSTVFGRAAERLHGVARAEMGRAHSEHLQALLEPAAEAAPGLMKRWVSARGPRARARHLAVEQQGAIPVNKRFTVGRFSALGPRMPGLPGIERIHCRCRVVPVFTEET